MPPPATNAEALVPHLKRCGYADAQIARPFVVDQTTIDVAAFAGKPWDNWSACLAAVNLDGESRSSAAKASALGTVSVFVCGPLGIDWWGMGPNGPTASKPIGWSEVGSAFHQHKDDLAPSRIYNAKLRKPARVGGQLWFFDAGLMPAVEKNRGETLLRLVENAIAELHGELGRLLRSDQDWEDLYRTVFWELAAKILHDKRVPNFINLDLMNLDQVFDRIGRHHGETGRYPPFGKEGRRAIDEMAKNIANCGSLADVSAEAIADVYENALLDNSASKIKVKRGQKSPSIRKQLGIHGTPFVLINHMLAQMWGMIEAIVPEDRYVFEPACGHAPFLTRAVRWLRQWDATGGPATSHDYMREHLRGMEADGFAIELAKLALTLADEPHGNKWAIRPADMFEPGVLAKEAKKARILLANPPYETLSGAQRRHYDKLGEPVTANTKAIEMLKRTLPYLPPGGVLGVVLPVGVLHDKESKPVREELLSNFELSEISVFADNLFDHGDHEVAVLTGCKKTARNKVSALWYRRVRESCMAEFKERLAFSWERQVEQNRFAAPADKSMWLPDLVEIWDYLASHPRLEKSVWVQQGRQYWQEDKLQQLGLVSRTRRAGFVEAVLRADDRYTILELPKRVWIDPSRRSFRTQGGGAAPGTQQVLVNYAPVSRDPWRLKAVVDDLGVAASSRFVTFRPKANGPSRRVLWAILNSPAANAFAHCFSGKRETLVGEWKELPLPAGSRRLHKDIESACTAYLAAVEADQAAFMRPHSSDEVLRKLMALDAEVLRLYDLPPRLERQLLDLFTGVERKGVGCDFRDYYPAGMDAFVPLHELISEEYARSTLGRFREQHKPTRDPNLLAALRSAAEAFSEE